MTAILVAAFGVAIFLEGLAFALAPSRMEGLLAAIAKMPRETRRMVGLAAMALGLVIVWAVLGP